MDAEASNLIDLILRLLKDPAALAEFQENPDAVLAACGASTSAPRTCTTRSSSPDDDDDDNRRRSPRRHHHHVPPPPHPHPGESDHDAAVRYIKEYVTNNYVDDRDTIVDNSVNQQIDTGGGDVDQVIRTSSSTASGDGAVAAGGDIATPRSPPATATRSATTTSGVTATCRARATTSSAATTTPPRSAPAPRTAPTSTTRRCRGGGALSVAGDATGDQGNTDSHNVDGRTTDTTDVDVDDSFNTTRTSTSPTRTTRRTAHLSTDSHNVEENHVLSHNDVQDVTPV